MAGKVTQVNVEGRNYGFVAGQAAKGACTALAADWVKPITLPEGTTLVDGMIISVVFVNTTSVGYSGTKTVYSSDGLNFFYDQALTDPVELPPAGCYDAVNVQGQEYTLACFPVITFGSLSLPVCDSRGHYAGGALWAAGDTVAALYLDGKFMLLYSVVDEVTEGVSSPVSSNAVARDCVLKSEITDEVAVGNMYSVYSDAVARAIAAGIESQYDETRTPVQGTNASNIVWHCIKLRSGLKICSGRATSVRNGTQYPSGYVYYAAGTDEIWNYPSNFFTATPMCIMRIAGATKWMWTLNQKKGTNNQTDIVCPACPAAFSNETVYYNILAIGY